MNQRFTALFWLTLIVLWSLTLGETFGFLHVIALGNFLGATALYLTSPQL